MKPSRLFAAAALALLAAPLPAQAFRFPRLVPNEEVYGSVRELWLEPGAGRVTVIVGTGERTTAQVEILTRPDPRFILITPLSAEERMAWITMLAVAKRDGERVAFAGLQRTGDVYGAGRQGGLLVDVNPGIAAPPAHRRRSYVNPLDGAVVTGLSVLGTTVRRASATVRGRNGEYYRVELDGQRRLAPELLNAFLVVSALHPERISFTGLSSDGHDSLRFFERASRVWWSPVGTVDSTRSVVSRIEARMEGPLGVFEFAMPFWRLPGDPTVRYDSAVFRLVHTFDSQFRHIAMGQARLLGWLGTLALAMRGQTVVAIGNPHWPGDLNGRSFGIGLRSEILALLPRLDLRPDTGGQLDPERHGAIRLNRLSSIYWYLGSRSYSNKPELSWTNAGGGRGTLDLEGLSVGSQVETLLRLLADSWGVTVERPVRSPGNDHAYRLGRESRIY